MGCKVTKLSNSSEWNAKPPTIQIKKGDDGWQEAYENWLKGKNPTTSKEWKKGVIASTEWV